MEDVSEVLEKQRAEAERKGLKFFFRAESSHGVVELRVYGIDKETMRLWSRYLLSSEQARNLARDLACNAMMSEESSKPKKRR
jgi:hypothetical protein